MIRETIRVRELTGPEDAEKIRCALHQVWGVRGVDINEGVGEVTLIFNEKAASLGDFRQAIREKGFEVDEM